MTDPNGIVDEDHDIISTPVHRFALEVCTRAGIEYGDGFLERMEEAIYATLPRTPDQDDDDDVTITRIAERGDDTPMGEVERRTLERCADIVEHTGIEARDTEWDEGVNYAKRYMAKTIRALASVPDHPIPDAGVREGWVAVPRDLIGAALYCVRKAGGVETSTFKQLAALAYADPADPDDTPVAPIPDQGATADDAVERMREAGEWRPVEQETSRKGLRRSPKYYPAIGEACRMSGPNCDDADGYTWSNVDVLWRDRMFIVTRSNGCWPTVTKLELALFEPALATDAVERGEGA